MLCDKCKKNEASIHMSQNINGMQSELHLCSECAQKDTNAMAMFNPNKMFDSFFDTSFFKRGNTRIGANTLLETVESMFEPLKEEPMKQERSASAFEPLGLKLPFSGEAMERPVTEEIKVLKDQLVLAVQKEEYENAAKLRDQIKALEAREVNGNE